MAPIKLFPLFFFILFHRRVLFIVAKIFDLEGGTIFYFLFSSYSHLNDSYKSMYECHITGKIFHYIPQPCTIFFSLLFYYLNVFFFSRFPLLTTKLQIERFVFLTCMLTELLALIAKK